MTVKLCAPLAAQGVSGRSSSSFVLFLVCFTPKGVLAQHLTLPPSFEQREQPLQIYSKQGTSGFVVSWEPLLAAKE